MESLDNKLKEVFANLKATSLAAGEVNDASINDFADLANSYIPNTPIERTVGAFIRHLYKTNKTEFEGFIAAASMNHYALLLGGKALCEALKLPDSINIYWDRLQGKLIVSNGKRDMGQNDRAGRNDRACRHDKPKRGAFAKSKYTGERHSKRILPAPIPNRPGFKIAPLSNAQCVSILNELTSVSNK